MCHSQRQLNYEHIIPLQIVLGFVKWCIWIFAFEYAWIVVIRRKAIQDIWIWPLSLICWVKYDNSMHCLWQTQQSNAFAMETWFYDTKMQYEFRNYIAWMVVTTESKILPQNTFATYIWHPISLRPITISMDMIHGAQHILSFHRGALVSPEFGPLMWLTTFDCYLFHVYSLEYEAVAALGRLIILEIIIWWQMRRAFKCLQNANDVIVRKVHPAEKKKQQREKWEYKRMFRLIYMKIFCKCCWHQQHTHKHK